MSINTTFFPISKYILYSDGLRWKKKSKSTWTTLIQTFGTMITHPEPALYLFLSKEEKVLQDLGNGGEKRNSEPTE